MTLPNRLSYWNKFIGWFCQNDAYWYFRQHSLILEGLKDVDGAIAAAKKSLALAEKAGNPDYVRMNKAAITEWSK